MAFPVASARTIGWCAWDGPEAGIEHLTLRPRHDGLDAAGVVIGVIDGESFGLTYRVALDGDWRVRLMTVTGTDGRELRLEADGHGSWRRDGQNAPSLAGCLDIDLRATPFTNTLPIRRLGLNKDESATIPVAYVDVPSLAVERLNQRYTALEPGRLYRFEGLDTGFTADLPVDPDGYVLNYPGLFRRL